MDQLELLQQVLNQTKITKLSDLAESPKLTVTPAKQGTSYQCFLSKTMSIDVWIVDTRASDHMIGSLHGLLTYKRCDRVISVTMADVPNLK